MKKVKFIAFLVLVLSLIISVASSSAQGPDGSGWWTGFTIQNVSGTEITADTTAYHLTGGSASTYSNSTAVPDGFSVTFHPGLAGNCPAIATNGCRIGLSPTLPPGFEGSVVVSSNDQAVAVANLNNNASGSVGDPAGTARAAYQGTAGSIASTSLFFPTVKNNFNGQTTAFFVQAAGADANVEITYSMNDGSSFSDTQTISANRTYVFVPSAAGVPSCNGGNGGGGNVAPCFGGAVVASTTGSIAGSTVEYVDGAAVAEFVLSTRGLTPSDAGAVVVAPALKNNFNGGNTGAVVLNTGATQATVDLAFTVTNTSGTCSANIGDTDSDSLTIDPGESQVVSFAAGTVGSLPNCVFYAMVANSTGGQPIAITVNENRVVGADSFKSTYSGFNSANASGSVFFPLVKENFNANTTGLTLVNAGSTNTQIEVTYTGESASHILETLSLAPGEAVGIRQAYNGPNPNTNNFTVQAGSTLPTNGDRFAVQATVMTGGATIVGIAQESSLSGTIFDVYNVEGFNQ
jgi:hypothetical protein